MADRDSFPNTPPSSEAETINDFDSTLGSETSSISETMTSSITDYEYEGGRRYHAYEAGRYMLPNDDQEASRLDLQHRIWGFTLDGSLHRAPIDEDKIKRALDVGTGTGIWAIDFADKHPNCHVIGTDLSPIQPTWVPPNCEFLVDDADSGRDWAFGPLDFIHSRLLVAGFRGWERYVTNCFANLVPGGWVEYLEVEFPLKYDDGNVKEDPLMRWSGLIAEAGAKAGCDFQVQNKFVNYLEKAGFTNIKREDYKWPVGPWPKDEKLAQLGAYGLLNLDELLNSGGAFLTRFLGWTLEEVEVLKAQCKKSMKDASIHRYFVVTVHYAQKPVSSPPQDPEPSKEEKSG